MIADGRPVTGKFRMGLGAAEILDAVINVS